MLAVGTNLQIPKGGWFSLMLAAIYAYIMLLWFWGRSRKDAFFRARQQSLAQFVRGRQAAAGASGPPAGNAGDALARGDPSQYPSPKRELAPFVRHMRKQNRKYECCIAGKKPDNEARARIFLYGLS